MPKAAATPLDPALLNQTLSLTANQRAQLARQLLLSLEPPDYNPDAEKLWAAEIQARLDSFDRGQSKASDWREAVERIRHSLQSNP
jgi:putative addiction module component (TIGR02574 family)